jgi:PEP-CTERM motif
MKKIGIVLVALVAILVLPGAAKADSITGGSVDAGFLGIGGNGTISGGGTFSFDDSIFGNSIKIGSFNGDFTSAGFTSSPISCGPRCFETQYTASFVGTGASAGETGTITIDVDGFGNVVGGSESINGSNGVPEPGTLGMFAAGLLGVGLMLSRRSKAAQVAA